MRFARHYLSEFFLHILADSTFFFVNSGTGESSGNSNDLDNILLSIKHLDITPDNMREFLPKVNWEQLASMYVAGRSGAECEARYALTCYNLIIMRLLNEQFNSTFLCLLMNIISYILLKYTTGLVHLPALGGKKILHTTIRWICINFFTSFDGWMRNSDNSSVQLVKNSAI